MTFPAFGLSGYRLHAFAQRLVRILRYLRVHGDGHVGHASGKEFFPDPASALDRVGMKIGGMRDQPGGVSKQTFALRNLKGLLDRVVPEFDVVQALVVFVLHSPVTERVRRGRQVVKHRMVVVVAMGKRRRGKGRAPLADRFTPEMHVTHKFALGFRTRNPNGFLGV